MGGYWTIEKGWVGKEGERQSEEKEMKTNRWQTFIRRIKGKSKLKRTR